MYKALQSQGFVLAIISLFERGLFVFWQVLCAKLQSGKKAAPVRYNLFSLGFIPVFECFFSDHGL